MRLYSTYLLLVVLSIGSLHQANAQGKLSIVGGIGFPESANAGLRIGIQDQAQIGFSIGAASSTFSILGDIFFHFAGKSSISVRKPWYFRIGFNYYRFEDQAGITRSTYLNIRLGREFNITERIGIAIDAGGLKGIGISSEDIVPALPSGGIVIFYKF